MSESVKHDEPTEDYYQRISRDYWPTQVAVASLLGAADYLDEHPEYATDSVLADAWRRHVAALRAANAETDQR